MTNEQVLKGLQSVGLELAQGLVDAKNEETIACIKHNIEIIEKSIDALEKQIPQKPIDNFFDKRCPFCNSIWGITKDQKFCPKCGQAIDWSEDDRSN